MLTSEGVPLDFPRATIRRRPSHHDPSHRDPNHGASSTRDAASSTRDAASSTRDDASLNRRPRKRMPGLLQLIRTTTLPLRARLYCSVYLPILRRHTNMVTLVCRETGLNTCLQTWIFYRLTW